MKKLLIALVVCLAMLALIAVPALAQAQKVSLEKAAGAPGGGSVVFNGPAGNNQFECELALKGVAPKTAYNVYLDIYSFGIFNLPLGSITSNAAGNANLHHNCPISDGVLPPGPCDFGIHVTLAGADPEVPSNNLYFMSATVIIK
jgi:hypothetical protein